MIIRKMLSTTKINKIGGTNTNDINNLDKSSRINIISRISKNSSVNRMYEVPIKSSSPPRKEKNKTIKPLLHQLM